MESRYVPSPIGKSLLNRSLEKKVAKLEKQEDHLVTLLSSTLIILAKSTRIKEVEPSKALSSLRKKIRKSIDEYNKKVARYNQKLKYGGELENKMRYPVVD